MAKASTPYGDEVHRLLVEVVVMRDRMIRAGLYRTSQKMTKVVQEIGWEVAAQRTLAAALQPPREEEQR